MHTGHTCVLGGAPNAVLQPQKILDAVRSCAWISRPITASNAELGTYFLLVTSCFLSLRPCRDHFGRDAACERFEVVDEHRGELSRLLVVLGAVRPGIARFEHLRRHAGAAARDVE